MVAPTLNNGMAGHLTYLLLEYSQEFMHCIYHQAVQGVDNQIVDKTNEAGWVRERNCIRGIQPACVFSECGVRTFKLMQTFYKKERGVQFVHHHVRESQVSNKEVGDIV